jgi:hypothetical protein
LLVKKEPLPCIISRHSVIIPKFAILLIYFEISSKKRR